MSSGPADELAVLHQTELARLLLEVGFGGAGAADDEANVAQAPDHRLQRLERKVEALLVDESADEQDQLLVRSRVARSQLIEVDRLHRLEIGGVDAVLDRGDLALRHTE